MKGWEDKKMPNDRADKILQLVNDAKKIDVTQLADKLHVSKVTIRKDLTKLEDKGLLQRKHGFALINNPNNLSYRLAQNYDTKLRIAQRAAQMVAVDETIMIESGSTCALLAAQLGKLDKHVTIITISYFIANFVERYPNLDVFLLGGKYQSDSQVVVGPMAKAALANFRVGQLFIGTDGFDPNTGFYGNDIMRTDIVQAMAQNAQALNILTDSSKFAAPSIIRSFTADRVHTVVTDSGIPQACSRVLQQSGVQLIQVDA
jgi:DeoR/GlpR family transcriptional regulator of sugar metabolism